MFSKTGVDAANEGLPSTIGSQPWSLGSHFALWFALASLFLVSLAAFLLFTFHNQSLDLILDDLIAEKLHDIRSFLKRGQNDGLISVIKESKNNKRGRAVFLRLIEKKPVDLRLLGESSTRESTVIPPPWTIADGGDSRNHSLGSMSAFLLETPGMSQILPLAVFEERAGFFSSYSLGNDFQTPEGKTFRISLFRFYHFDKCLTVHAAIDKTEDLVFPNIIWQKVFLVLFLAFAGGGSAGYFISKRGMAPISQITSTAALVDSLALGNRIPTSGLPLELFTLAKTVNSMLSRLEESFSRLSRFSSDIAHELRTPVHNLRGLVEVALTQDLDFKKTREMLNPCLEECTRLSKLIENLLFLAKAENPQTKIEKIKLEAKKELTTLFDYYEPMSVEAGIEMKMEIEENLFFPADRVLFQRALGNLIENSFKNTAPGGMILLASYRRDSFACFQIRDTGKGIASEHLPHIFDRFFRADFARGASLEEIAPPPGQNDFPNRRIKTGEGAGLGLSIVKGIVNLHGGLIEVTSTVGSGTSFIIRIPLAD